MREPKLNAKEEYAVMGSEPFSQNEVTTGEENSRSDTQEAMKRAKQMAERVLSEKTAGKKRGFDDKGEVDERTRGGSRQRRRNRWGDSESKVNIPGVPTAITADMTKEQLENYTAILRIEEITRKLRLGDYLPTAKERSVSPEPIYNSEGKRVNTREYRYKKKLEEERAQLIEQQQARNPGYQAPSDYRKTTRFSDKYFFPVEQYPDINFIGMLIGPRGNTLKRIEAESGCKISIRGKGSVKEGKTRSEVMLPGADEDLHCMVVADSAEKVARGIKVIKGIVAETCLNPESHNELKRLQLRELASLNGTLREDDETGGLTCPNC
ncbi:Branchpoint-bridging protein, partial [Zancudomyces culisetae]